jgi:glycosyltransferase involved in cell wall biosynthesis
MRVLVFAEPFTGLLDFFAGRSEEDAGQPAFYQVVRELDRQGHRVVIIVPGDAAVPKRTKHWTKTEVQTYRRIPRRGGLAMAERLRIGSLTLRFLLDVLQSSWYGLKETRKAAFDLAVGHWESATLAAHFVARIRKMPNISRLYGSNLYGRTGGRLTFFNLLRNLNRVVPFLTPADLYICTQDGTRSDRAAAFFRIPAERFVNVLNGVRKAATPPNATANVRIEVTFIGHLQSWKHPMRVLGLVPEIAARHPTAHFNFVGNGSEEPQLRRFISIRGLEGNVTLHGRLTQREKDRVLFDTDIYVSFYSYSNLSNTLLEAMNAGKAIVTVDEGDTSLVIRDGLNGVVLPRWDKTAAIQRIEWLIEHPEERRRLGACAKEWADNNLLSWQERARLEVSYYERVARRERVDLQGLQR